MFYFYLRLLIIDNRYKKRTDKQVAIGSKRVHHSGTDDKRLSDGQLHLRVLQNTKAGTFDAIEDFIFVIVLMQRDLFLGGQMIHIALPLRIA